MLEQDKITQEQYDTAIAEVDAGLAFKEGTITSNNSLTQNEEAAVKQIAKQYASEHDLTYDMALQKIQSGGYKIYITEDKSLQDIVDDAYTNNTDWIKTKTVTRKNSDGTSEKVTVQLQSAMVVIDHKTGYVVAARGVLGEKTPWGTNRVTSAGHQPGSSIKPLAVISPSLQEGLITAGTVVDDTPVSYGSYSPHNDKAGYYGLMNIRYILRVSRNIPEVKMMRKLTPAKSIEYLKSYGISTLSGNEGLSLALGAVDGGVSPLEMAGAYATIANNGVYIEPTFYIKVEDQNGNVIMEAEQETHRVLSEQNAWLVQSLLTEPTGTGLTGSDGATGTRARVTGMQTCGKTGTTNDTTATWFCGFTPYYSAAMYFGFDEPQDGGSGVPGSGTVASRWGTIMNKIHKGLDSASFTRPSGIVTASICKDSGLLATAECEQDQRGSRVYTEYYAKGTAPTQSCTTHVKVKICKETGKVANEYCKDVEEKVFITRPNSDTDTSWQQAADAEYMAPTENCDTHNATQDTEKPVITLKDVTKDTIEIKINDKFTIPTATATDNIDGDITKNITTQIKMNGTVVEKIDTSKVGTYTITYTVEDAAKNTATKTITLKVLGNEETSTTNTVETNTVTEEPIDNSATNIQ
jgi:penicillin-binding protein 1A